MFEKPDLPDERIISCLCDAYGVTGGVEFLPIGLDNYAWAYKVHADDGSTRFLKVRKGDVYEPSVALPRYLNDIGVDHLLAAIPTRCGELWARLDDFNLILYPFINGDTGMKIGLSDNQWVEFGTVLKRIHSTKLPDDIAALLNVEKFDLNPKWSPIVKRLNAEVERNNYSGVYEKELASFWKEKLSEIESIVGRAEELGRELQRKHLPFVPCHADIHTANIMLDHGGDMFIIDWDEAILAPRERDLMFVLEYASRATKAGNNPTDLFFEGYGNTEVKQLVHTYYRYEWVVQDLGGYGESVFYISEFGDVTKRDAVQRIKGMFAPGGVVNTAYEADVKLASG